MHTLGRLLIYVCSLPKIIFLEIIFDQKKKMQWLYMNEQFLYSQQTSKVFERVFFSNIRCTNCTNTKHAIFPVILKF